MKKLHLLIFSLICFSAISQSHTFRCLEAEVFAKGCTTCDNARTGKMITGIEATINSTKIELLNPIVVKYDSASATLIDYKNNTAKIFLANSAYANMTSLLKAIGQCTTPDGFPKIDTLQFTSDDSLRISLSGDSVYQNKVYINTKGRQKFDTAKYETDTLYLSLENDLEAVKKIRIPSGGGGGSQTLSWNSGNGNLSISGGNTVNLDGRYLLSETDGSITNEGQLGVSAGTGTTSIITSNTSGANGVTITAAGINTISESTSSNGGTITITGTEVDGSTTNELQTVDTFNITTNQLRLSLSQDAPTYTVNLNPYLDNTDGQTLSFSNPNLSISGGNSVSLSALKDGNGIYGGNGTVKDSTYAQLGSSALNPYVFGLGFFPTFPDPDFGIRERGLLLDKAGYNWVLGSDSLTSVYSFIRNGKSTYIKTSKSNNSQYTDIDSWHDYMTLGSYNGSESSVIKLEADSLKLTSDQVRINTDTLTLKIAGSHGSNGQVLTSNGYLATWQSVLGTDSQKIDTFQIISNNLRISLQNDGEQYKSVDLSGYLDNTDSQSLSFGSKSGSTNYLNITSGAGVQVNDGTGINISRDASNVITINNTGDLSTTNEIQNITFGTKSGSDIPLNISGGGTGITLTEGANTTLTRNSSTQVTISAAGIADGDKGDIDVTSSGSVWALDTNSVMTIDVQDDAITNAKLANVASQTFKGRATPSTGDPEDLTIAQAKSLLSLSGSNTGDQTITLTSDVTGSGTGSFATTISNDAVTYAKFQNVGANSFLGRIANTTGDVSELTLSSSQLAGRGSSGDITAISLGSGLTMSGSTLSANDVSSSNELQTVDTFVITTNQLRLSLSQDAPTYTVNLNPYLDNTDEQNLSFGAKSGSTNYLNISSGAGVQINDGSGITVSRDASNVITITNTGDLSSTNENQDITFGTKSGNDIPVNISNGSGVTITQGTGVTIDRNSSTQITINSSGNFTIEDAQDAVGSMINASLQYVDGTPLLAINDRDFGDLTSSGSGLTWTIDNLAVTNAKINDVAWSKVTGTPTTLSGYGITDALSNSSSSTQSGYFGDIYLYDDGTPSHYTRYTNSGNNTASRTVSINNNDGDRTISLSGDLTVSSAATVSGTNTGDQTITLTGNVTGSGTGSFATTIANDAVTYAKIQNVGANSFLANTTASSGDVSELALSASQLAGRGSTGNLAAITLGGILSMSGTTLSATEVDGSTTNELQDLSFAVKSGANVPLTITSGLTVNFTEGSGISLTRNSSSQMTIATSTTNTASLSGNVITSNVNSVSDTVLVIGQNTLGLSSNNLTSTVNGVVSNSISLASYLDNTDSQNMTVSAKSGSDVPIAISGGTGYTITEGAGITITRNSSTQMTIASTGGYTDENAQDAIGAMINSSLQYVDGTPLLAINDRDFGDMTTSGSGLTWTIDNLAVTNAKINDVAWSKVTGTPTTLSGYGITDALSNSSSSTQSGYFGDIYLYDDVSPSHYTKYTNSGNNTALRTVSINNNDADRTISLSGDLTVSSSATISGTNTGDQTITLTSDVTGSGTGSFATTIASNAVTFSKMQDITTDKLIGRDAAGTGDPAEIGVTGGIEFDGSNSIRTSAFTGDVTKSAGGTALTIANDAVTYAKIQNVGANSFLANTSASSGDAAELSLSASQLAGRGSTGNLAAISLGGILSMSGTTLSATEVDGSTTNELQDLSFAVKSGSNVPLAITSGLTVNFTEGTGITLTRNSSSQMTIAASTTNVASLSGNVITSNVNSVSDTVLVIGQNALTSSTNTMTSNVNGVTSNANIINSISNTSSTNSLSTTVNGVAGSSVNIINTNVLNLAGNTLTETINGVADTSLVVGIVNGNLASNSITLNVNGVTDTVLVIGQNALTLNSNSLTSTVNGVVSNSISLASYLDNTDSQNMTVSTKSGSDLPIAISGGSGYTITEGAGITLTRNSSTQFTISSTGGYTDENAQDAIGSMINASLQYVDATPVLAINDRDFGDITASAVGLTWTVDNGAISTAKLADSAVTAVKIISNAVTTTGLATNSVTTAKILDNTVADADIRQSAGLSVIGRSANSTGNVADITAGSDNYVLRRSGTSIGFGQVATGGIADSAITEVKLISNSVGTTALKSASVTNVKVSDVSWSKITSTPTTLSGYGITDALSNSTTSTQDGFFGDIYLKDDVSPSHYLQITNAENLTANRALSIVTGNNSRTLTFAGDATISGTNSGDQTITLTSDVTGSGTGSFATTIASNAVTDAKFRQSAGLSVVGRSANTTGNVADITAANDGEVLRRSGTAVGFGTVATSGIANDAITYAKIQNVAANSFLGNNTSSSGDVAEVTLSASQLAGRGSTGNLAAISVSGILSMSGTTLSATEVDGSTTNELQTLSFQTEQAGDVIPLDISNGNTVYFDGGTNVDLSRISSTQMGISFTEVDGSITNELQTIDTFKIKNDSLIVSLSSDGQFYKGVKLKGYRMDTAYYFPEDYGAIANDGNDDRSAIQSAIDDACSKGGGIVWIGKGEYKITTAVTRGAYVSGIHLCSNVMLMGTGFGSVLKSTLTTAGYVVVSLPHSGSNVKIANLQIKADSLPSGAAIYAGLGITNLTIENIKIDRGTSYGIWLKESSKGSIVNCDIQNNGPGHCIELTNCNNYVVKNNFLYSNASRFYYPSRGNAIQTSYNDALETRPYANIIEGNLISNTGGGITLWGDSMTTVVNNTIRNLSGGGIYLINENSGAKTYIRAIKIQGNTISQVGFGYNTKLGIYVEEGGHDISIENNYIDSVYTADAGQGGGTGIVQESDNTIISGNRINHCYVNGISNSGKKAIISGNLILDCSVLTINGYRGISNSGSNAVINGNSVHDTRGTQRMDICIYNPGNYCVITSNNCSGAINVNIYDTGMSSVKDNNIE